MIEFVGSSAAQGWDNQSTTKTVTAPTHSVGDIMLLMTAWSTAFPPIVPNGAGWTQILSTATGGMTSRLYSRIADGTSDDSPSASTGATYGGAALVVYSPSSVVVAPTSVISPSGDISGPSKIATGDGQIGLSFAVRLNGAGQPWVASGAVDRLSVDVNWMCLQISEVAGDIDDEVGQVAHSFGSGVERFITGLVLG